jgi:hypothetical protein
MRWKLQIEFLAHPLRTIGFESRDGELWIRLIQPRLIDASRSNLRAKSKSPDERKPCMQAAVSEHAVLVAAVPCQFGCVALSRHKRRLAGDRLAEESSGNSSRN